jgi:hypothetical protein
MVTLRRLVGTLGAVDLDLQLRGLQVVADLLLLEHRLLQPIEQLGVLRVRPSIALLTGGRTHAMALCVLHQKGEQRLLVLLDVLAVGASWRVPIGKLPVSFNQFFNVHGYSSMSATVPSR